MPLPRAARDARSSRFEVVAKAIQEGFDLWWRWVVVGCCVIRVGIGLWVIVHRIVGQLVVGGVFVWIVVESVVRVGGLGSVIVGGFFAGAGSVEIGGDRVTPDLVAERVDIFLLGAGDGLDEVLGEIGDGRGGASRNVPLGDGGDGVGQGGAEVAEGNVAAGEVEGDVTSKSFCGLGLGFFAGVEGAEVGVVGGQRNFTLTAIQEGKSADAGAIRG